MRRTLPAVLASCWMGTAALAGDLRSDLLATPISPLLGGETTRTVSGRDAYSFLIANASRSRQRPFAFGNRLFNTNWVKAPASVRSFDGLGPLFNRVSCSGCHTRDGRGRPPDGPDERLDSMLVRISLPGISEHGAPKPVPGYGDQISEFGNAGVPAEARTRVLFRETSGRYGDGTPYMLRTPVVALADPQYGPFPPDMLVSARVAPAVFGLGLLQSIPEDDIVALSDPDDRDGDGISGRPNWVFDQSLGTMALGRFGWKANQATLLQQNAAAALGDIGITSPIFPTQNCAEGQVACAGSFAEAGPELDRVFLEKLTLYTMTLAVPAQRESVGDSVRRGASLFRGAGCAYCHMPTMKTGHVPSFPELSDQTIHPFTDLLLHDMGEGLADGRPDYAATGREWRTPPLWGLGLIEKVNGHQFLLHDGRARGVAEAILWHGGEAEVSREAFRKMEKRDRDALIAFLMSL